jgi:6-pyruvoyltetrahydropterin/6-carboxytetrahydropterin synthase
MGFMISKDFEFAAAHHLVGLPAGHKCARVHGHNYIVRVQLHAETLDETGFVTDYANLSFLGELLTKRWDHRDLNEVLPDLNPTAEHLAAYLAHVVRNRVHRADLVSVGVSETPKVWAWYSE